MLDEYFSVLIFVLLSVVIGAVPIILGYLINCFNKRKPNQVKTAAYECGFPAFDDSRSKFDVRYYLVAIIYILFDIEIAFLLPWALVCKKLSWIGIGAGLFFLLILTVGFIYEWHKGTLEWE